MNSQTIGEKVKMFQIGKSPVVVLPLKEWNKVATVLEEYEMSRSRRYHSSIKAARAQIKRGQWYEFDLRSGTFKNPTRKK